MRLHNTEVFFLIEKVAKTEVFVRETEANSTIILFTN